MVQQRALHDTHEALGARFGEVAGREVARNYGDTAVEYDAVRSNAGLADRSERALLRVTGRDPVRMVQGLVTNDVAGSPEGRAVYAAMLTPKGRMIADMRVFRREDDELLLDVDARARENVLEHFKASVPPLFARVEDVSEAFGVLGVYGPDAERIVAGAFGEASRLDQLGGAEDDAITQPFRGEPTTLVRTGWTGESGLDVLAPTDALAPLWDALADAGAHPVGHATLEVLRIEAGRPRWGAELDERVFPLEAGLESRAISRDKGCYTGQEVIVRILDRGHVNWLLRGFLLGDGPVPAPDTKLFVEGESRKRARITSACSSPRHGQTIALGYAHRAVEPPVELRLGDPDGREVDVVELPFPATALGEPFRAANA